MTNTNQPQHTPEPWRVTDGTGSLPSGRLVDAHNIQVAKVDDCQLNPEANAQRIVRCINACANTSNPEAIPEVISTAYNLRACQIMYMANRGDNTLGAKVADAAKLLDEALAKLEGNE